MELELLRIVVWVVISQVIERPGTLNELVIAIIFLEFFVTTGAMLRTFSWPALLATGISIWVLQWLDGVRTSYEYCLGGNILSDRKARNTE
jgi:hypothetical protein